MEKKSWSLHRALFRVVGEQLPRKGQCFKNFVHAIPLTPREKEDGSDSTESLLEIWEKRGGIELGKYDPLRTLLSETGLISVLGLADEHIAKIMEQLHVENGTTASLVERTPDLYKDNDQTKQPALRDCGSELFGKRKRSESPTQQKPVAINDRDALAIEALRQCGNELSGKPKRKRKRKRKQNPVAINDRDALADEEWERIRKESGSDWKTIAGDLEKRFLAYWRKREERLQKALKDIYVERFETEDMFTDVEMKQGKPIRRRLNSDYDDIKTSRYIYDLFHLNPQKRSVGFIEGPAGSGKTTLCERLAYLWAKNNYSIAGRSFDFTIALKGKSLKGDLKKSVYEQLFTEDFCESEDTIYECLLSHQKNCLMIIDGVDELSPEGRATVMELLKGKKLRHVNLLLTGRSDVSEEFIQHATSHVQIQGFSLDSVKRYISKYFGSDDNDFKHTILSKLKNDPQLSSIMMNPSAALQVCKIVEAVIPANWVDAVQ